MTATKIDKAVQAGEIPVVPRPSRYLPGGMVFHVLNRAVGRRPLFAKEADYQAFERVLEEALRIRAMRVCAYCVMPNHWHFVLWPERNGELSAFLQQLTNTHVKRWKEHRREVGYGHLYQGRFKCFPVQTDVYFYDVVRYVERGRAASQLGRAGRIVAVVQPGSRTACGAARPDPCGMAARSSR